MRHPIPIDPNKHDPPIVNPDNLEIDDIEHSTVARPAFGHPSAHLHPIGAPGLATTIIAA